MRHLRHYWTYVKGVLKQDTCPKTSLRRHTVKLHRSTYFVSSGTNAAAYRRVINTYPEKITINYALPLEAACPASRSRL